MTDDADPTVHVIHSKRHLVTLLDQAHVSWKAYEEDISGSDCPLRSAALYAAKHNPFVYFANVQNSTFYCSAHERPYGELAGDLRDHRAPRYVFITPNLCNDMHNTCSPIHDSIAQGDTWLKRSVPMILGSKAYKHGGVLFITWDEGEGGDGPIGLIAMSPYTRKGYASTRHYTHSSTLRTIEEIFDVRPLLGDAAHASDLRSLFTTFP